MSTSLHTRLAAEINIAEEDILQVTEKREELLKLGGRTRLSVISKRYR